MILETAAYAETTDEEAELVGAAAEATEDAEDTRGDSCVLV